MTQGHTTVRCLADVSLIVLFLGLTGLPALRNLLGPPTASGNENRTLAPLPELKPEPGCLTAFPAQFEAFYNDQFGFRDTMLRWLSIAKVRGLRVSSSPKVVLGKQGWLYFAEPQVGTDYEAVRPFHPEQVHGFAGALQVRRDWLAQRGIRFLFVLAPDKQTIYPHYLPNSLKRRSGGETRADQLVTFLRAATTVPVLDLRQPLRQAKDQERLFNRTDSHWNDRGALLGYQHIAAAVSGWFPVVRPWRRSDFLDWAAEGAGGDLARMLGLSDCYREEWLGLWPRNPRQARTADPGFRVPLPDDFQPKAAEHADERLPRAVMFRDSFANNLIPFLSEHFRRVVYEWQDPWEFDFALVERERPDLVIQEMVERKLMLIR